MTTIEELNKNKIFEKDKNEEKKFNYKMIHSCNFKKETLTDEEIEKKEIYLDGGEACSFNTLINRIKLTIETDNDKLSNEEVIDMIYNAINNFEELKRAKLYR